MRVCVKIYPPTARYISWAPYVGLIGLVTGEITETSCYSGLWLLIFNFVPFQEDPVNDHGTSNHSPVSRGSKQSDSALRNEMRELKDQVNRMQSELRQYAVAVDLLHAELLCSICLEKKRDTAFHCGHTACSKCSKDLKNCHLCRDPIVAKIKLFV